MTPTIPARRHPATVAAALMLVAIGSLLATLGGCEREQSPAAHAPASEQHEPAQLPPEPADASATQPAPRKDPMARTMTRSALKDAVEVADAQQAALLVADQRPQLGLGQDDALPLNGTTADERGNAYYQIQQTYKSIPVFGATGVLEIEGGKAVAVTGSWTPGIAISVEPAIDAESSLRRAVAGGDAAATPVVNLRSPAELVVFMMPDGPHLAWRASVAVPAWAGQTFAGQVFVDANAGALLLKIPDRRTD
jgi:hypothetical protein